jgi:DNA modification methylase
MAALHIIDRHPGELRPSATNARTHTSKQIAQIARSIMAFGFNNPVLVDAAGEIIAGHGRVLAALELGLNAVPTVRLDHLSAAQKRAYVIADNRLAELAGWDKETLAIELQGLSEIDLGFEVTDIGFEIAELDLLISSAAAPPAVSEQPPVPSPDHLPKVARRGDLWLLEQHRVFCGDALDPASYQVLLGSERARMIFTDPPYNVRVQGHVSGLGRAKHDEFAMASGEMSQPEFTSFLEEALSLAADASADGAIHFVCMDWRHIGELLAAASGLYAEVKNICVWVKSNAGMGSLYRSQHELVGVFKVGRGKHINNVELGRFGRNRTNVWAYAGMNSFQAGRDEALAMHPTVKPTDLVADAIYDCSTPNDIILDPFGGSGTTILAAHRARRRARVIELDPGYVNVSLFRFARETGIAPIHASTGQRYDAELPAHEIARSSRSPRSRIARR